MKNIKYSVSLILILIVFSVLSVVAQEGSIIEATVEDATDNKPTADYNSKENTVVVTSQDLRFSLPNSGNNSLVKSRTLNVNFLFSSEGKTPNRPLFIAFSINETAMLSLSGDIPVTSNFDSTVEKISNAQIGYTLKKTGSEEENKKMSIVMEYDEPSSAALDISVKSHSHLSMGQMELEKFIELSQAEEVYIMLDKRKCLLHIPKNLMPTLQELAKASINSKTK